MRSPMPGRNAVSTSTDIQGSPRLRLSFWRARMLSTTKSKRGEPMNKLDLDARRLETRANELIAKVGLADEYGQNGVLSANYDANEHLFVIEDEQVRTSWEVPEDHFLTAKEWAEMCCFIFSCTADGCLEEHTHYES